MAYDDWTAEADAESQREAEFSTATDEEFEQDQAYTQDGEMAAAEQGTGEGGRYQAFCENKACQTYDGSNRPQAKELGPVRDALLPAQSDSFSHYSDTGHPEVWVRQV